MDPKTAVHRAYSVLTVKAAEEEGGKRIIRGMATTPKPDRMEDVVEPKGAQFSLPLPLLSQHDAKTPIGFVTKATITADGIEIEAEVVQDTGLDYIETAWKQIKAKLVRGLSIGFRAIEYSFIKGTGGIHFTKWDWLELSAVTIPANAGATINTVKAFHLAAAALAHAREVTEGAKRPPAASATNRTKSHSKGHAMTLAERLAAKAAELAQKRAELSAIEERAVAGEDLTDDDDVVVTQLSDDIARLEKDVATLEKMEKARGTEAVTGRKAPDVNAPAVLHHPRTLIKRAEGELIFRHAAVALVKHVRGGSLEERAAQMYPEDRELGAYMKAAQNPADTTTPGWAAELVRTTYLGFMDLLMPESVFPRLAAKGVQVDLTNPVSIPTRTSNKRLAGAWVSEGSAIPVRAASLTSISLSRKKLGVISTFTRELAASSTPQIQGLIQQFMIEDTAEALDGFLLDSSGGAGRPPGLGAAGTKVASVGNDAESVAADVKAAVTAVANAGGLRNPVWLINPTNVIALSFMTNAIGEVPEYLRGVTSGTLATIPMIQSTTVPADEVFLIDAADFVSDGGQTPEFDVSDVATLHEEDTTPLPIVDGTGAAAKPVRSLFQTYSVAVRGIWPLGWQMRRAGMVYIITGVHWGEAPTVP